MTISEFLDSLEQRIDEEWSTEDQARLYAMCPYVSLDMIANTCRRNNQRPLAIGLTRTFLTWKVIHRLDGAQNEH